MEYVTVVVVKDKVVDESFIFVGERAKIAPQAEAKFLEICREQISNFDEYDADDIAAILDNGYEEFGNGSVCITWPIESNNSEDYCS